MAGTARRLRNWILTYKDYTSQLESPDSFHIWTALSVLSAAVQRKIYIDQGFFSIYPNLYVLLIAPPGKARKSQAMHTGKGILDKVPGIHIEANKMSPEKLVHSLSHGHTLTTTKTKSAKGPAPAIVVRPVCSGILYSAEFSVMLGIEASQNGMISLLSDLYDCPNSWRAETLGRGTDQLNNVYLSVLGATTPQYLSTSIPEDAIGQGFSSRIIYVCENNKRHSNARPKITPGLLRMRDDLIEDLKHIASLGGEAVLTEEADQYYDAWYQQLSTSGVDERFWGYIERKPIHMLKIATLLSLAEGDSLVINRAHIEASLALLERIERRLPDVFSSSGTPTHKDIMRVMKQLMENGGQLEYERIIQLNLSYVDADRMEKVVLRTMREAGIIEARDTVVIGTRYVKLRSTHTGSLGGHGNGGNNGAPAAPTVAGMGSETNAGIQSYGIDTDDGSAAS